MEIVEIDWAGLTAYTLVLGFLIIIGALAWKGDLTTLAIVAGILGPFIGAIVTFFFGIKRLDNILKRIETLATK